MNRTQYGSCTVFWASLVAQMVKNLPAMQETWVRSLGWEDPLEKRTVTLSSILAWRIPWTEEPGRLQSMGCKELDTTEQFSPSLFTVLCRHEEKKRHTLCSWDVCSLTQQFHSPTAPILYASVLITFTSSSSSLNWESRVKTRHRDNGILCCDLWLYFSFKPQYFTLWITMFFVGKILNLKCCRWPFIRR